MADEWYFQRDNEIRGPVTFAELLAKGRSGELALNDVLRQGTDGAWISVESISSLFPNLKLAEAPSAADLPEACDAASKQCDDLPEADTTQEQLKLSTGEIDGIAELLANEAEDLDEVHDLSELSIASSESSAGTEDFELSDDPTKSSWFARVLGTEVGPMPWDDLLSLAVHGELSTDDEVRPEAHAAWRPAAEVPLLFTDAGPDDSHAATPKPSAGVLDLSELGIEVVEETGDESDRKQVVTDREDWFCNVSGSIRGPMSFFALRGLFLKDELSAADLVRQGEAGRWVRPATVPGLAVREQATAQQQTHTAAEADSWYCSVFDTELGPMRFDDLQFMARHDEISRSDRVRQGAAGKWVAAGTVDGLWEALPDPATKAAPVTPRQPDWQGLEIVQSIDDVRSATTVQSSVAPAETGSAGPAATATVPAATTHEPDDKRKQTTPIEPPPTETVKTSNVPRSKPPADADWYVRTHGVEQGPIAFEELKRQAEKGRITAADVVRCGETGEWVAAAGVAGLFDGGVTAEAVKKPLPHPLPPPATPAPSRSHTPKKASGRTVAEFFSEHRDHLKWGGLAAVALLLLFAAGMWWFAGRDQEYVDIYTTIWNEHRELRARGASDDEWNQFRQQVTDRLKPIVEQLEQTAGPHDPVKQHLLWAGRDYLPRMLADAREEPSENEQQFASHLEFAMRLLGGEVPEVLVDAFGEVDHFRPGGSDAPADMVDDAIGDLIGTDIDGAP